MLTEGTKKFFAVIAVVVVTLLGGSRYAQAQYQQPVLAANDTLANVHYDYKWEFYGGLAYSHFDAGPQLTQGANLGGFDAQATRFFTRRWGVMGNVRGYYGTSGVEPNVYDIKGPFVSEHMFLAGPEYRGPSNEHVSMTFHALVGGAYGYFNGATHLDNGTQIDPEVLGLFNNQTTFASAIGGSIDLNRSSRWVFRISPDATLTHFQNSAGEGNLKEQFALSVGVVYRWRRGLK
ncbi:hypothetical protein [Silvibacterium sp.]|uniref:hypothetical protein n=1 Tax=Silvibacterium sp. TaxID=1964179 RepID=UPI0039E43F5A